MLRFESEPHSAHAPFLNREQLSARGSSEPDLPEVMAAPARYLFSPLAATYPSSCVGEWRRTRRNNISASRSKSIFQNYSRAQCYGALRGNLQQSGSIQSRKNHTEAHCKGFSPRRHLVLKYLSIRFQLPPKRSQGEPQNSQKRVKRLKRTQRTDSMLKRHRNNHRCPHRRGPRTICSAESHKHKETLYWVLLLYFKWLDIEDAITHISHPATLFIGPINQIACWL